VMRLLLIFCICCQVFASDIEDASEYNRSLTYLRAEISQKYDKAQEIARLGGDEFAYLDLLTSVRSLKQQIHSLEENWRRSSVAEGSFADEPAALWDVGETTLSQLIMEYGSVDYLYVIPQELSAMKMTLFSGVPLPRESWSEMIEMILAHNGIGVKRLNSFAKQLYVLKLDPCAIEGIVSREQDLELFAAQSRLFYVLSPPVEQLKSLQAFFERFSDPKQTTIQAIGSKVVLISNKETVEKLLGLYKAVWEKEQGKVVRLLRSSKIVPQEAEKVLKAFFADSALKGRPNFSPVGADELTILPLPQGLVLVGENETVSRGEKIIADLESQLDDPGEKVIYWYCCKHTNPEDVAAVLEKVYDSLVGSGFEKKGETPPPPISTALPGAPAPSLSSEPSPPNMYPGPNTIFNPVMPANPPFIQPGTIDKTQKLSFGNFIVDTKTTSILMVVKREELPKIKALLKKMDVPKRMVQLDVLLVEKRLTDRREVGFDLLQFGANGSGKNENAMSFGSSPVRRSDDDHHHHKDGDKKGGADFCHPAGFAKGVLSYIFSRNSGKWPAMDIRYNFLLAQEDVYINSNPSTLATNQTPVTMSVVDEISINNGSFQTQSGALLEQSYTRAQYGTTIVITPTIHLAENGDETDSVGSVSLQTNIEFDTTKISFDNRPPVTRRHIENEVCIPDGETVILGGLRSKMEQDSRDKIPFLGDLPGIGKLFGAAKQVDVTTEMFIFITPRIIRDPTDDLRRIRQSEYRKRAGDIPEFLACLDEAKNQERNKMFSNSLKMLFDIY
jgi:general secretion pathway protein D